MAMSISQAFSPIVPFAEQYLQVARTLLISASPITLPVRKPNAIPPAGHLLSLNRLRMLTTLVRSLRKWSGVVEVRTSFAPVTRVSGPQRGPPAGHSVPPTY